MFPEKEEAEQPNSDESISEKLDVAIDEIMDMQRKGLLPTIEQFIAKYPEIEQGLRDVFPALQIAERLRNETYTSSQTAFEFANHPRLAELRTSDRFQVVRPLDRGGLGVVSVAMDQELHREVALKEIREDRADDNALRLKFVLEAEVTGSLEHPGIVPVYALGASADGRPYYAMRLIKGSNLREHIRNFHSQVAANATPFDGHILRQLMRRFLVVCEAIDYAHSRGVLHRDLKPSNVMLGRYGETLVVDWGLAKANGSSVWDLAGDASLERRLEVETLFQPSGSNEPTRDGSTIGTPAYAPPEQILGKNEAIGIRSDVYGLGAILYELLTNQAPASGSLLQITHKITSGSIPHCRAIQPLVPKPIEAICSKAMALEYDDRYESASELRAEIERWLDDSPVAAYEEPLMVRAKRWMRKHQTLVSTLLAIGTMSLVGAVLFAVSVSQSNSQLSFLNKQLDKSNTDLLQANAREIEARNRAEFRERAERWERYRSSIAATVSSSQVDNRPLMKISLDSAPTEHRNWEWKHFHSQLDDPVTSFPLGSTICPTSLKTAVIQNDSEIAIGQLFSDQAPGIVKHEGKLSLLRFSQDAKRLVVRTEDGILSVWDTEKLTQLSTMKLESPSYTLKFRPDNKELFICLPDKYRWMRWAYETEAIAREDETFGDPGSDFQPSFNSKCDRLLTLHYDVAKLFDVHSGELITAWNGVPFGFSPDGTRFFTLAENVHQIRDSQSGQVLMTLKGLPPEVEHWSTWQSSWSPDGNRVMMATRFPLNLVMSWNLVTDQVVVLRGHTNGIWDVEVSPDGRTGVSVSQDITARIWDLETGEEKFVLRGHRAPIRSAHFNPNGKRLVTSGDDAASRIWNIETGTLITPISTPQGMRDLCYSEDGTVIVSNAMGFDACYWNAASVEQNGLLRGHTSYVYDVAFSPDGTHVASAAWDGTIRLWDLATGQTERVYSDQKAGNYRSVSFSPSGQQVVATKIDSQGGVVVTWNTDSNTPANSWICAADTEDFRACFDSTGKAILAGTPDGTVRCLDPVSGATILTLSGHEEGVFKTRYPKTCSDVVSHPDGKRVFSAGYDGAVCVWDIEEGTSLARLDGHRGMISRVVLSKDGELMATAGQDGKVRLWNANTYDFMSALDHGSTVYSVSISPDKTRIATGCADGLIRLWDLATHSQVAELRGHSDYVHAVAFSPDGTRIVSGSGDHTVRIWDTVPTKARWK